MCTILLRTLDPLALDPLVARQQYWYDRDMAVQPRPDYTPRRVADLVETRLAELAKAYAQSGRSLGDIGSPEDLADQMLALVPRPSAWDDAVGPFYTTAAVAALLGGVSRQAVADRRRRHTLFALQTLEGDWVYPTFQFAQDASVYSIIGSIQQRLPEPLVDGWTLAGWLTVGQQTLGGMSVVEWIRASGDTIPVDALIDEMAIRSR